MCQQMPERRRTNRTLSHFRKYRVDPVIKLASSGLYEQHERRHRRQRLRERGQIVDRRRQDKTGGRSRRQSSGRIHIDRSAPMPHGQYGSGKHSVCDGLIQCRLNDGIIRHGG